MAFSAAIFASAMAAPTVKDQTTEANKKLDAEYKSSISKILQTNCTGCHSGAQPAAGLSLDKDLSAAKVAAESRTWEKVVMNVRAQIMPPSGQMPDKDRSALVGWIQRAASANCQLDTPGKVTIRRLNRAEYNNTVRDLFGLDLKPAADFPSDDVGEGFDNIGDVLTLTPLHLEQYLSAARKITQAAIYSPDPKVYDFDLGKLQPQNGWNHVGEGGIGMYTNAKIDCRFNVQQSGAYTVTVTAGAQQAGPDLANMAVSIDGILLQNVTVGAPATKPTTYKLPIQLRGKQVTVSVAFTNDYYEPNNPNPQKRDRNLVVHGVSISGPEGMPEDLPESHRRIVTAVPSNSVTEIQAARTVLTPFVTRAYRRPATLQEIDRLIELYKSARKNGDRYEAALRVCLQAVLVSPHFLFRVELDSGNAAQSPVLNGYELASRLSYFLWSSMPDDQLLALAQSGKLLDSKVLEAQVKRLVADKRANAMAENFCSQWLQTRRIAAAHPDPKVFPGVDAGLMASMEGEVSAFFMDMLRNNRPAIEFVSSDFTMLDRKMAQHYAIPGAFGDQFQRVNVAQYHRGGVLGMAAVLTVTSNPNRTSPVKRGKFVMEALLGTPPPPPPPNVGVLDDTPQAVKAKTMRERLDQHRANPACASCHKPLDAMGFTLENFDGVGRWRTQDGTFPVDAKGTLPDGKSLDGVESLKTALTGRSSDFYRHLTEKLLVYGTGRGLSMSDACFVESVATKAQKEGGSLLSIILAIVESDAFRKRGVLRAQ